MPDEKQPFCWECASKITEEVGKNASTLIGCSEEKNIHCYSDAKKMCPLMKEPPVKVLIVINGGCASLVSKPDNVEVEIRDYDIEGEWDVDDISCKKDDNNDRYQEMVFPAEDDGSDIITLPPMLDKDVEMKYRNFYNHCGYEWESEWDSMCNEECPVCNKEIEPCKSEEI